MDLYNVIKNDNKRSKRGKYAITNSRGVLAWIDSLADAGQIARYLNSCEMNQDERTTALSLLKAIDAKAAEATKGS